MFRRTLEFYTAYVGSEMKVSMQAFIRSVASLRIIDGWFPRVWYTLAAVSLLAIITLIFAYVHKTAISKGHSSRSVLFSLAIRFIGTFVVASGMGLLLSWLISDVWRVFEVSLGWYVIVTAGLTIGIVVALIVLTCVARGTLRVFSCIVIVITLLTSALTIDRIYGEYTTFGSLVNYSSFPRLEQPIAAKSTVAQFQKSKQSYPTQGKLFSAVIPANQSQFRARNAIVYLPPAALSKRPPALPVMVMFAGQPGSPGRYFGASGISDYMNSFASKHHGVAPIVISPDQNGGDTKNSLCADTDKYGKAETYLTQDVPNWIKRMLPADTNHAHWAIGGFSQGGTCSVQLGLRHPDLFAMMLPSSSELEPTSGNYNEMIRDYFASDAERYQKLVPTTILKQRASKENIAEQTQSQQEQSEQSKSQREQSSKTGEQSPKQKDATKYPLSQQGLFMVAGSLDKQSVSNMTTITQSARDAGMKDVTAAISQGSGHVWLTVRNGYQVSLPWAMHRMGLLNEVSQTSYQHLNVTKLD